MEYQFTHTMHGVIARCSMDHEAFARWLNNEIIGNDKALHIILEEIERFKAIYPNQYEFVFEGKEYSLYFNGDEVIAKANNLEDDFDESLMEEGFNFYNEESVAFCGLNDFEAFLKAYQKFLRTYH
ncbi:MAG: YacL family protein [Haemophilus parahaemolyticus]|uniref:UPF0231 family protein n=1 Tax=Haemophilus parahaemolyticus TaxID=735 RepID=UPI0026EC7C6F|nr:YacL family protein [Haemophilus parahaemolyticus]MBS6008348.1 YacL family protein [Haemophilus parahaemolyticus]